MKKSMLLFLACFLCFQTLQAQIKAGVKAGLSTMDVKPGQFIITNGEQADELGLSLTEANYGGHFGFFVQAKMGNFILQPEVLLNTNMMEYNVKDLETGEVFTKKESFQNLDVPILMGLKLWKFRFTGGPVAHIHLNNTSELVDFDGYDQKFDEMTWGYQAGVGLDIWKFMFDLRYEGNMQNYDGNMSFFGNDVNFDRTPGRMIASVGIKF